MDLQDGAEDIWAQGVIEQNRRWLLAYLYAATGDRVLAEDAAQEVFLIAYQKRAEFRKSQPFGAWLRGIARNVVRRHLEGRTRGTVFLLSETAWDTMDQGAAGLEKAHVNPDYQADRLAILGKCLGRLTERARGLIEGRYKEGLSLENLARKSGLAAASVPVVLHRARAALSECVKKTLTVSFSGGDL